jgi:hypothetical protein
LPIAANVVNVELEKIQNKQLPAKDAPLQLEIAEISGTPNRNGSNPTIPAIVTPLKPVTSEKSNFLSPVSSKVTVKLLSAPGKTGLARRTMGSALASETNITPSATAATNL